MSMTNEVIAFPSVAITESAQKAYDARKDEIAAHPNRIYAMEGKGNNVATLEISGINIKTVCRWFDESTGEAGIYPHTNVDGQTYLLDYTNLIPTLGDKWPLNGIQVDPVELPLITVRGEIKVTFNE